MSISKTTWIKIMHLEPSTFFVDYKFVKNY